MKENIHNDTLKRISHTALSGYGALAMWGVVQKLWGC